MRDHPRICGEHLVEYNWGTLVMGSSPHMRGTRLPCKLLTIGNGIIPAYAGNTRGWLHSWTCKKDHPRICGEHFHPPPCKPSGKGSSPHMRGTPLIIPVRGLACGIIPAYAGNTFHPIHNGGYPRDHPRICGEHVAMALSAICAPGSSPHMRGTRTERHRSDTVIGIIPAYAGNTPEHVYRCSPRRDHPRICGEHTKRL